MVPIAYSGSVRASENLAMQCEHVICCQEPKEIKIIVTKAKNFASGRFFIIAAPLFIETLDL